MSGMRDRLQRIERGLEDPRVDVLALVNWVYSEQRAHQAEGRGMYDGERSANLYFGATSTDGIARIAELNRLGCRVDVSGSDTGELHPVAEVVHELVQGLQRGGQVPAWLIRHYGQYAALPPGYDLDVTLGPVWKSGARYQIADGGTLPKEGAFKVVHDGSNAKVPLYCPLELNHGPDYQAELMREYEHWHLALRHLVAACGRVRELGRLVVTGPAIAREPWRDRGAVEVTSRDVATPATRKARPVVQQIILAVLAAAVDANVVKGEDGLWREVGKPDGAGYTDHLIERLINQGLAFHRCDGTAAPIGLGVTVQGHETLKAARLVA